MYLNLRDVSTGLKISMKKLDKYLDKKYLFIDEDNVAYVHIKWVYTLQNKIKNSEKCNVPIKRDVSEITKKQIAFNQNWKCATCDQTLPANYEIDHIIALMNGGNNEESNLQALCRNCHGLKTFEDLKQNQIVEIKSPYFVD